MHSFMRERDMTKAEKGVLGQLKNGLLKHLHLCFLQSVCVGLYGQPALNQCCN